MQLVNAKNISYQAGESLILANISFQIKSGDFIGLIGPNGAGKTSLAKLIIGQIKPSAGTLERKEQLRVGYVPQTHRLSGASPISVREILAMSKVLDAPQYQKKLQEVGLDSNFIDYNFHDLSGGQKQKVLIARSLLQKPELLIFDEPLSAVDYNAKIQIYKLLSNINHKQKIAILFISHDVDHVITECHEILCLNKTLHTGCHPLDFAKGKITPCKDNSCSTNNIAPVHHHHN